MALVTIPKRYWEAAWVTVVAILWVVVTVFFWIAGITTWGSETTAGSVVAGACIGFAVLGTIPIVMFLWELQPVVNVE